MNKNSLFLITVIVIFAGLSGYAQNHNQKLLVKYNSQTLTEMQQSPNSDYEVLEYFVDKGFHFIDMPDKPIEYEDLKKINPQTGEIMENYVISESDLTNFNPLEFNCEIKTDKKGFYKAGNTGKLIIVQQLSEIENRIENEKRIFQHKTY